MPADSAPQSVDAPAEDASEGDYTLLALLGERPQVLTLLLWSLVDKRGEYPKRVIVLTTAHGEHSLRAKLLEDDYRGSRIRNQGHRWGPFCQRVLGYDPLDPDKDIEVPTDTDGTKIEDIEDEDDEQLFASWCYDLVRSLTRKTEGPLYGLIAGGRKTMTPDITTAFSLYGLRDHKLFHVISSKDLERNSDVFWPRADLGHNEYADDVHLVQKPFLHLQMRLENLLSDVDGVNRRSHHEELLDELYADRQALAEPQKVTLRIRKGRKRKSDSTLSVWDDTGEPMAEEVHLSVKSLATLLFLWDNLWQPGERRCVALQNLMTETADKYRRTVYDAFEVDPPDPGDPRDEDDNSRATYLPWWPKDPYYKLPDKDYERDYGNNGAAYSDSVSYLKGKMMEEPVLKRYFLTEQVPNNARSDICRHDVPSYAFRRPLPENIDLSIEVSRDEFNDLRPLTTALKEEDPFRLLLPTLNVVNG
jgi:CRISPR-associated protein (TIGR02584 family)